MLKSTFTTENMELEARTTEAVELLRRLIATPSISRDEGRAADILEAYMKERGLRTERHGNNVWSLQKGFDASRPTILLNAHIDTVKPADGWRHDPFRPTLEGETLYGLGANDCGGGLVSLLQTFIGFETAAASPSAFNLIYLASCEEEVSGRDGIESVLPLLPPVSFAIVGEPTGMQPAIAEKGLMVIDATAHGKAGHAAREEGENAIYKAMQDIQWLAGWKFPKESGLLGPVKQTVTIINAGTQHNVVPAECTFTIDVRSNELYSNEEILEYFREHLQSELKPRSLRLGSSHISPDHPFVLLCKEKGLTPFGSPTLSDQALMRFPSLKLGPGESARSHTADEYIRIGEIERAIALYTDLLSNFRQ